MNAKKILLCATAGFSLLVTVPFVLYYSKWGDPRTITSIPTNRKVVALTIDDGPHPVTTPQILSVLKEKDVRATFFILGENAERHPALVSREVSDGHELAIHAFNHKPLTGLSRIKITEQLDKTAKTITNLSTEIPQLFRPPGGAYNNEVIDIATTLGYSIILWNIDTHDWQRPPANSIVNHVLHNITPGSIILMHDGQYPLPTATAISIIIDSLREQGYEFLTVSDLLHSNEVKHTHRLF